tara:strand:- start:233 stop:502 length:270 start_codon:yes stop_codon:yes gene_type:complete
MRPAIELPGYKKIYAVICRYGESGATKIDIAKATGIPRRELNAKVLTMVRQGAIKELDKKCFDPERTDNDGQGSALFARKVLVAEGQSA